MSREYSIFIMAAGYRINDSYPITPVTIQYSKALLMHGWEYIIPHIAWFLKWSIPRKFFQNITTYMRKYTKFYTGFLYS